MYYGYFKDRWSKNFDSTVAELEKVPSIIFLIKDLEKVLFKVDEKNLENTVNVLVNNVKSGAWHDLVSQDDIYIIFGLGDIHKLLLNSSSEEKTWLRMKDLEPNVRKYSTIKEMVLDSRYAQYINI